MGGVWCPDFEYLRQLSVEIGRKSMRTHVKHVKLKYGIMKLNIIFVNTITCNTYQ